MCVYEYMWIYACICVYMHITSYICFYIYVYIYISIILFNGATNLGVTLDSFSHTGIAFSESGWLYF